jgi:glycosidase/outer membrane protein assembly factor BamB
VFAETGDYGEWLFPVHSPVTSSPVFVEDTLYFATMTGEVYALDPVDQQIKWQVALPIGVFSTPAIAAGRLYLGDFAGTFYALDAASGEQLWQFQAGDAIVASPTLADGRLFFGDVTGAIYALDAQSGQQLWKYQSTQPFTSSPLVQNGLLFFGGEDGFLYALDPATGEVAWMFMAESGVIASPTLSGDGIFVASQSEGNSAQVIDIATGKARWRAAFSPILASAAAADDALYIVNLNGTAGAVDPANGNLLWTHDLGALVIASPAVAADQVIVGDLSGKLHALDRQTGAELWTYTTNGEIWSSPAIAGDTVFFGSADGNLYALDRHNPQLAALPVPTSVPPEPQPAPVPAEPAPTVSGTDNLSWWNDRVFYEIFVRSFQDSDGDGIGDLQGLIGRLDYLNDGDPATTDDLGVTGLWLMPITQSPSYHGYDVTDYRTIEEDYGANQDFQLLVEEAHQRGMAVIVDMVMNHTSNQHPWFQQAAYPGAPTENWYIWSSTRPDYLSPWGTPVWHQPPAGNLEAPRAYHNMKDYYYGLFWEGMPDLNYRNGAVTTEMFDILKFWLDDLDADGFRLDAVRHLIEDGEVQENTPETHAWLQNFDNYVHTVNPDALTVGEIWDDTAEVLPYVPEEVDIAFEFKLAEAILAAVNTGDNALLSTQLQTVLDSYPEGQFAPFLANHDMNRAMTQLGGKPEKARLAAALLLSMPGVPFIYYGEEIGLTGVRPEDINVRRPMQWDASSTAGFTRGEPWTELGTTGVGADVDTQNADPNSLFNTYRALIHLRQDTPALRAGDTWVVGSDQPQVFSLLRASGDEAVLLVANLSDQPLSGYQLELPAGPLPRRLQATLLDGEALSPGLPAPSAPRPNAAGGFSAYTPFKELPPYTFALISLAPP